VDHGEHAGHQEGAEIKKVLESQENTHTMVEVQLGVQDHLAFKWTYMTRPTSDFGDLHMHGKISR
jgi:hypothetical protein